VVVYKKNLSGREKKPGKRSASRGVVGSAFKNSPEETTKKMTSDKKRNGGKMQSWKRG